MTNLRSILTAGAFALATSGCGDGNSDNKEPNMGSSVDVDGRIVQVDSANFYTPKFSRSFTISGPEGKFYSVSTTNKNRWNELKVGDSVNLEGKYAGYNVWKGYNKMPVADVEWANLEKISGDKK